MRFLVTGVRGQLGYDIVRELKKRGYDADKIDDALKGLLDAVGKVKTVDETKLDASLESEVEP